MAKITRKGTGPSIKLLDLLRKRRISLKKFISDFGINSFESLRLRCERMGVVPPAESKFNEIKGDEFVNSPTEGILVLEAPKAISEKTGEELVFEKEAEELIELEKSSDEFENSSNDSLEFSQQNKNKKQKQKNKWNNPIFQSTEHDL